MSRLVFNWPDEASERIDAARGRLEVAGAHLGRRPIEERLRAVRRVVASWTAADSPWRRELAERLGIETPFHPNTVAAGLDSALGAWRADEFEACARREVLSRCESQRFELSPMACTSVLAGGSIPMPTLLSGLLPLVLGSPVLIRDSSKDPVSASLLARSIAEEAPDLGSCIEVVRFPTEDDAAMRRFLSSPCVVASGTDETLSEITSKLKASQRFVGYGHRFSIAVLGPRTVANEVQSREIARGLALDVARWDQLGCLSPVAVYLVGLSVEDRRSIAHEIAQELEEVSKSMPRGGHPTDRMAGHAFERQEAQMRAAARDDGEIFEGEDFVVSLESDNRPRPAPLLRFLNLFPIDSLRDLDSALGAYVPHLSTAAIAGFHTDDTEEVKRLLGHLGLSRTCSPGRMQTPPIDWPHDGMPLFQPLARLIQHESDRAPSERN